MPLNRLERTTGFEPATLTLAKVGQRAGPGARLPLSCPFRYDWARFSTARYISFFPFLPKTADRRAMARRIFGSVEKKGKRYRVRYQSEGRWVTAPVTFTTKADANAWLANQHTDTGHGVWVDPSLGKELFGHYDRNWLETRSDLEETTRANYEGLLRLHVLPAFGHCRIAEEHRQRRPPVAPGHHEHRLGDD